MSPERHSLENWRAGLQTCTRRTLCKHRNGLQVASKTRTLSSSSLGSAFTGISASAVARAGSAWLEAEAPGPKSFWKFAARPAPRGRGGRRASRGAPPCCLYDFDQSKNVPNARTLCTGAAPQCPNCLHPNEERRWRPAPPGRPGAFQSSARCRCGAVYRASMERSSKSRTSQLKW